MRFLESLLYGLFSGLAEFLPVSTQAHQALCMQLFGASQREPLRDLFVHIALVIALLHAARSLFERISRERNLTIRASRSKIRQATGKMLMDLRVVRTAALPMMVMLLFYIGTIRWEANPAVVAVFMILNGVLLIIPEYMRHGNKDARSISAAESIIIGVVSGLSMFPGMSRVGGCISSATACGADRQNAVNWALMLTLPALILFAVVDIINMFVIGFGGMTFLGFLGYLISAAAAYIAGYFSVLTLRFLADKAGYGAFAYYSWGAALFMFILYLIT